MDCPTPNHSVCLSNIQSIISPEALKVYLAFRTQPATDDKDGFMVPISLNICSLFQHEYSLEGLIGHDHTQNGLLKLITSKRMNTRRIGLTILVRKSVIMKL